MRTNNHRICPLTKASETQPNVTHGAAVTVRKEKGGVFSTVTRFRLSFQEGNQPHIAASVPVLDQRL